MRKDCGCETSEDQLEIKYLCRMGAEMVDELLDANSRVIDAQHAGGLGLQKAEREQRMASKVYRRHTGLLGDR